MVIETRQYPADPNRFPSTPEEEAAWRATVEWFGKPLGLGHIVSRGDPNALAEAILIAANNLTDEEGLRVPSPLTIGQAVQIATALMAQGNWGLAMLATK